MCQEGLLTEEQLQHALSVQASTGRPLGEVIVTLGYASAGAVANALAEQYGGTLRTEYGVSAGLGRLRTAPPAPSTQPTGAVGGPRPVAEPSDSSEVAALEARLAELQQLAAGAVAARERAESAERELEALRNRVAELDAELGASREGVAELTAKLEATGQPEEASRAGEEQVEALEARVAELEELAAGAVAAQERADTAERELEGFRNRVAELDGELSASREGVAELTAKLEAVDQAEEPSGAVADQVEALEARVAELEQLAAGAVAARERAESAERELEGLRTRVAELDAEPGASPEAVADPIPELQEADQPEEATAAAEEEQEEQEDDEDEEEHLLFVPSVAGYSLARRAGACPEPGTLVKELGGRTFVVARIGPSPLGGRLRCAYLEPAR